MSLLALALLAPGAGALSVGRHGHTTTLLPDGNFLYLGGVTGTGDTPTAVGEIFLTSAAAFGNFNTGTLVATSSATATLMGNGMVLVAGGFINGVPQNRAGLCNPATRTCADLGAVMTTARGGHTATLINKGTNSGKVLLCGGQTGNTPAPAITNSCEIFTPGVNTFAAVQAMSSQRMGHTASAIAGGRVFVSGGAVWDAVNSTFTYLSTNEIYDPENNQWQAVTALSQGRVDHSAVVLNNGTILISGGYNGTNKIDSPEEAWYKTPEGAGSNQNPGSRGYLDSAEIFDSYGGRVPVSGSDYLVMPYRVSRHAAVLSPDGTQNMYGGYGNIPPTFFDMSPILEATAHIDATSFDTTTATINTSSLINFLMEASLSRTVDGRIVDGDVFISKPPDRSAPSITVANAKIYLNFSTVTVDGQPVGSMIPGESPGTFKSIVQLLAPGGRVVFRPEQVAAITANLTSGSLIFPGPAQPEAPPVPLTNTSSIGVPLTFSVPTVYAGGVIRGTMTIISGSITDNSGFWTATLSSGTAQFTSGTVYIDPDSGLGVASGAATFTGLEGTIQNSTVTPVASPVNPTGDALSGLSMRAAYNSSYIYLGGLPYAVDKSTCVIRAMIFADDLEYEPSNAKWSFGTVLFPVFNHSALLTPAADVLLSGGRNCEADPAADCVGDGAATFTASGISGAFISQVMDDWPQAGKLLHKRAFHTSTLLPDGRILTCGGSDGTATLSSCELYQPGTDSWIEAGPMTTPRSRHTATLLPNGRVLAVGGTVSSSTHAVTSAEIYYPDTDRWIPVQSMAAARSNHTATLLPDGNVLVAGGDTINGYSSTSEIYISSSSVWIPAGNMAAGGRAQHTATLLKNGNVLVTGGINGSGPLRSTELYSFVNRTWSTVNNMNVRRYGHAANLLLDGRVMVSGGSDGFGPLDTAEIISDMSGLGTWSYTTQLGGNNLLVPRANHRATLLPNGKVMLTGGEEPGLAHSVVEGYDVDFSTWQYQGATDNRANHTAVLTSSGVLMAIGGWSGSQYLDTVQYRYFSYVPDMFGFQPQDLRNPVLSTATTLLDRGGTLTLTGNTSNFHNISEASGGGAGSMNSSFHNPRVYIQQIDNPSGFLTDLTTRVYTLYNGPNTDWQKTVSSITVVLPSGQGELPYGWYTARVAANGQFSAGIPLQISMPRPSGTPGVPSGNVLGTSSITWNWTNGAVVSADGYSLYASSDNVFITTVAFSAAASYTQTDLQPNTEIAVKVGAYNMGGSGPLSQSSTYYTLASTPAYLAVTGASFNTAVLEWDPNNNSPYTSYEVSMCAGSDFGNPLLISTPVPFVPAFTSTSTTITRLTANTMYYFRVRARNGAGTPTAFTSSVSTITVASVNNLTGTAISTSVINWSWTASSGADYYELFNVTEGTDTGSAIFIGSTTDTSLNQGGLDPNAPYSVGIHAVKTNPGFGPVPGPMSYAGPLYTLAVQPSPDPISPFTNVSTGSLTANWVNNANSTQTVYALFLSTSSAFAAAATSSFTTTSDSYEFSNLAANIPYYVKVIAINGDGIPSAATLLGYVYTWARPPLDVTPASVEMSGVTLTWDQNGNSPDTVYEVRGTTTGPAFSESVTTYLPFSSLFTGSSLKISGLLTSTTYYFQVTACNGEGVLYGCTGSRISARTQSVPPAYTMPGPNGAPSGSIGGTALPSELTTIHGWLPNTREVTLTVPAGSFAAETAIAISSSITSACGGYTVCGRTVEVAIYSQDGLQPQVPVTLDIGYECTIPDISKLVLARYNPVSGQCLPLETTINPSTRKITATLNHFSVFQLMVRNAATNLSDVQIYPNPFRPNRGQGFVTMTNMPAGAEVRVYSLSGNKVWEGTAGSTGIIIWRGTNKYGYLVASGVYLAVIDSSAGKKVFKLAVER